MSDCATHIVFGDATRGSVRYVLEELGKADAVLGLSDIFSVGPIEALEKRSGQQARIDWQRTYLQSEDASLVDVVDNVKALEGPVVIWAGNNAHEQVGLRFVLRLLHKELPVYVIHDDILDTPVRHFGECNFAQIQSLMAHKKLLSTAEKEAYGSDWETMTKQKGVLRTMAHGTIKELPETYFDEAILRVVKAFSADSAVKSARIIGEVVALSDNYVPDAFIDARIRRLVEEGKFEMVGVTDEMYRYDVKMKG